MRTVASREPIYWNCRMLSPDGVLMAMCDKRKAEWFLSRDLANLVSEEPYTFQLNFKPRGLGKHGEPFYMQPMSNNCVACGATSGLTKHHIVPKCFRRHFPSNMKENNSHDVLALCTACHDRYEVAATALKKTMVTRDAVDEATRRALGAYKAACAIVKHGGAIPEERRHALLERVRQHLNVDQVSIQDLETLISSRLKYASCPNWEKAVDEIGDLPSFVVMWRAHFLETMSPQFMPQHWDLYAPTHSS